MSGALRSLLFVPADSERKLAGATRHGADALILDLEDSVAPARKPAAREMAAQYLAAAARGADAPQLLVRINAWQSGGAAADLAAIVRYRPAGILLPKSEPQYLRALDQQLTEHERQHGLPPGAVAVIAIATETPAAVFALGQYRDVSPRLQALTWGGEDLAADLGAINRDAAGVYTPTFQMVRGLCLLGASAAGVAAIDAAFMNFSDDAALEQECRVTRRDGFVGKLAIHPAQVATINRVFSATVAELDWAQRVVAAFAEQSSLGVVAVDGKVVDRPHLRLAERLLKKAR